MDLPWKSAVLNLSVERRPAQTSPSQNRFDPQDTVIAIDHHEASCTRRDNSRAFAQDWDGAGLVQDSQARDSANDCLVLRRGMTSALLIRLLAPSKLILNSLADEAGDATVAYQAFDLLDRFDRQPDCRRLHSERRASHPGLRIQLRTVVQRLHS